MTAGMFFIIIGIVFLIAVLNTAKKQRTFEKESFYWVIGAILLLALSINPNVVTTIARWVHIDYPPSLLFLVAILFTLNILFKITCQISNLREQNKELVQQNIILEMRLKEIEKKINDTEID